ncbi:acyl-CoA reductase [Rhizorhabdus argentea]|uniref:acyl-CoA reductase n=1 Tax=Rhizorhabdus argentea TaxID=1387174 RepID=UPI0030EC2304
MAEFQVPLIIRGKVIEAYDVEFGGRGGATSFTTPSAYKYANDLVLSRPSAMSDLYAISFVDILDYLEELGARLQLDKNDYMQQALEMSIRTSGLSEAILRNCYTTIHRLFDRNLLTEIADRTIGIDHLEGWVDQSLGNAGGASIRAFGARAIHITAGNVPEIAAVTITRNAITRSDAIIKTPSNDPMTAAAIARTMIDMAPDHPITRHISVAYWKGGDEALEERLYRPANIEKIIAWGGVASIRHISGYLQPGIDLITLDPKLSSTIIGREAFVDDATMRDVATLAALDVGVFNQEGCVNARVIYAQCGTDDAGLNKANRFGEMVMEQLRALPPRLSGPAVRPDPKLADEVNALRMTSDWHRIFGGGADGGVIVSQIDEPVDFAPMLNNRVANIVPIDDIEIPVRAVTNYTQTIGIYPENLKKKLRDRLSLHGAQRIVSLGGAALVVHSGPQDGIEPMRRMCRWIMEETREKTYIKEVIAASAEKWP